MKILILFRKQLKLKKQRKNDQTKYYIYVFYDQNSREVQYVGQTVDLERRKSEHTLSLSRGHLSFKAVDGMVFNTKLEARFAEQAGMEYFNTLKLVKLSSKTISNPKLRQNNQRNEISLISKLYQVYNKIFKNRLTNSFKEFSEKNNLYKRK